jgi:hypothetical protein
MYDLRWKLLFHIEARQNAVLLLRGCPTGIIENIINPCLLTDFGDLHVTS